MFRLIVVTPVISVEWVGRGRGRNLTHPEGCECARVSLAFGTGWLTGSYVHTRTHTCTVHTHIPLRTVTSLLRQTFDSDQFSLSIHIMSPYLLHKASRKKLWMIQEKHFCIQCHVIRPLFKEGTECYRTALFILFLWLMVSSLVFEIC